jgi:hypothetical protein
MSRKLIYACCIFTLIYLSGLVWLITGLIISDTTDQTNKLSTNDKLLLKELPPLWVMVSFSIVNIAVGAGGCILFEFGLSRDGRDGGDDRANSFVAGDLGCYRAFTAVAGIYLIVVGSIYITWPFMLAITILYTVLWIIIWGSLKTSSADAQEIPIETVGSLQNSAIPTGTVVATPCSPQRPSLKSIDEDESYQDSTLHTVDFTSGASCSPGAS